MKKFPKVIRIEPSSKCNLRCRHCTVGTTKDPTRQLMPQKTFEKILKQIKQNKENVKVAVLYHGGEPLLNPNLESMIARLKNAGIEKTKIDTNAMLLTKKRSTQLIKAGLNVIIISIDGTNPAMNNWIRKGSNYKTVIKNVKELCKQKKKLKSKIPQIIIYNVNFLKSSRYENLHVPEMLRKDFKGYDVSIIPDKARKWHGLNPDKKYFKVFKTKENYIPYCDHIQNTISIKANGNIVPCCNDLTGSHPMGNIHKNTILEIWNNKKYKQLRKAIKTGKKLPPLCKNCKEIGTAEYLILKEVKKKS